MVKIRDELSGSLTAAGSARKPLTATDRARLGRGEREAREILAAAGARAVHTTGHIAVHPGGTARIGEVVDADLATGIAGLYVCDASVLPVAWGVPPTFTVLALGRRLGRRLAGRNRAGSARVERADSLP
jgi:choline dehydrogenase-like flavoprotein